jgi:hypothetical protein
LEKERNLKQAITQIIPFSANPFLGAKAIDLTRWQSKDVVEG